MADHSSRGVLPSVVSQQYHREASIMRRYRPTRGFCAMVGWKGGVHVCLIPQGMILKQLSS